MKTECEAEKKNLGCFVNSFNRDYLAFLLFLLVKITSKYISEAIPNEQTTIRVVIDCLPQTLRVHFQQNSNDRPTDSPTLWCHSSTITCQIIISTCKNFVLTCQFYKLYCHIIMSHCQKKIISTNSLISCFYLDFRVKH